MPETWITRHEAAALAKVHYNTIRTWEGHGNVRRKRGDNNTIFVNEQDVVAMAERSQRRQAEIESRAPLRPVPSLLDLAMQVGALQERIERLGQEIAELRQKGKPDA